MAINKRTKCPVCKNNIPIGFHLLFKDTVGLECSACHTLLGHTGKIFAAKFTLMVITIVFIIQLTANFKVRYENKRTK